MGRTIPFSLSLLLRPWLFGLLLAPWLCSASCKDVRTNRQPHGHVDSVLQAGPVLDAMLLVDSVMQVPEVFEFVSGWVVNSDGSLVFGRYPVDGRNGYQELAFRSTVLDRTPPSKHLAWSAVLDRFSVAVRLLNGEGIRYGQNRILADCPITSFTYGRGDDMLDYEYPRYLTVNATTDSVLQRCLVKSLIPMDRGAKLTLWRTSTGKFPGQK